MGVGVVPEWSIPTKAALFQARKRLGPVPLRMLYDKAVVPLADPQVAGGFYRSWRLMSIDGLCLDVADTDANVERFGRPASSRGEGRGGRISPGAGPRFGRVRVTCHH